ncbi:hypothetical protein F5884DRAFT_810755 [Xylogone sp. PMI_703]|nr:hypothetical protein F5884DRAFT_810755 [Xylogone sp. PMI_703]
MDLVVISKANTALENVANRIRELGVHLCSIGDKEVGQLLQLISNSPHQLHSLRTAILEEARSSSSESEEVPEAREAAEAEKSEHELWLDNFDLMKGNKLSIEGKTKILKVLEDLARCKTDNTSLKKDALAWCKNPSAFCGTKPRTEVSNNLELIQAYFDDYEQIENSKKLNPVRRKVVLLETFRAILREEQHLRKSKKRYRRKEEDPNPAMIHTATYRSKGINTVAERLWGHKNLTLEEQQRRRKILRRMARYGEKWSLVTPNNLILGLGNSKSFEQTKWSIPEIEAINNYITTLPVYSLEPILRRAMQAITEEWSQPAHVRNKPTLTEPVQARKQDQGSPHKSSQSARSEMNKFVPDGIQSLLDAVAGEGSISPGYTDTSGIVASTSEEENQEGRGLPEKQPGGPYISADSQEQLGKASECQNSPFDQNGMNKPVNTSTDFYDYFDPEGPHCWNPDYYDFLDSAPTY